MGIIQYACSMFRISTWRLYLLKVWVHCAGICYTIACYGIGTIIPDYLCQHGISHYRIYRSRLGVSVLIVLLNLFLLVSGEFNFSLFLCMIANHGEFDWIICSSLTVCSQLRYGSSTVTRHLKLVLELGCSTRNPHICYGQNMFFYNCSIISHLSFYHGILLL